LSQEAALNGAATKKARKIKSIELCIQIQSPQPNRNPSPNPPEKDITTMNWNHLISITACLISAIPATSFQYSSSTSLRHAQHSSITLRHAQHSSTTSPIIPLQARPKSKWDLLADEDDEDDIDGAKKPDVPPDMTYIDSNIKRQMANFDKLYDIGGDSVVNDVWVRAEGEIEWWFVGKIARVSGKFIVELRFVCKEYILYLNIYQPMI
jgi:hypothetical protein